MKPMGRPYRRSDLRPRKGMKFYYGGLVKEVSKVDRHLGIHCTNYDEVPVIVLPNGKYSTYSCFCQKSVWVAGVGQERIRVLHGKEKRNAVVSTFANNFGRNP